MRSPSCDDEVDHANTSGESGHSTINSSSGFAIDRLSYVTVIQGDLPLVLSSPHGGKERPDWVSNLTARKHVSDAYTFELTQELAERVVTLCNKSPFVVLNHLSRRKMDANRDINKGTEGLAFASDVYDAYHNALKSCCEAARKHSPTQQVLLLDIHGYATLPDSTTLDTCWIMVGHGVSATYLQQQANREGNTATQEDEWIYGQTSLGSLLEKHGLLAEPSSRQKFPSRKKYFLVDTSPRRIVRMASCAPFS